MSISVDRAEESLATFLEDSVPGHDDDVRTANCRMAG